jgi:hypothetical protein
MPSYMLGFHGASVMVLENRVTPARPRLERRREALGDTDESVMCRRSSLSVGGDHLYLPSPRSKRSLRRPIASPPHCKRGVQVP